jgi:tol-pal system-associated acyl-CoA thioesterase
MEKKIYYHDTDAGGVVYYANYLKFLEESRTEFLENKGFSVQAFHERGIFYAVRKCSINYRSPARYGDTIRCDANLVKITAAQLIFTQKIHNIKNEQLLVDAEVSLVCLNQDFRPIPIPEGLKKSLL